MATKHKVLPLLFLLLVAGLVFTVQARPLKVLEQDGAAGGMDDLVRDLLLGETKSAGQSNGGVGHQFTEFFPSAEVKDSGPSPGVGH
ncbi:hypothetical protein COCNU_01G010940 [Cocos nucifera]|uniref:Uncharacterized protein n=1 Tax=Cocos nucifera TaxID=13894 RepID=A0A8K0MV75_COCNU|nr:hypothetical protein COCNU_01G010940 [Cocos nucifera]